MSVIIRKIINHVQNETGYLEQILSYNSATEVPSLVGDPEAFPPWDKLESYRYSETKRFNKANNANILVDVGEHGVYYLELLPNCKLQKILFEPEDIKIDVHMGSHSKGLVYSFYNPTSTPFINIEATLVNDKGASYKQIQSNPSDIVIRKRIIREAIKDNTEDKKQHVATADSELADVYISLIEETGDPKVNNIDIQKRIKGKRSNIYERIKSPYFILLLNTKIQKKMNHAKKDDKKELWHHALVLVEQMATKITDKMEKARQRHKDDSINEIEEVEFAYRDDGGKTPRRTPEY